MYTVHKAKTRLSKLIRDALSGKKVTIAHCKEPVVQRTPVGKRAKKRVPGRLKGKMLVHAGCFGSPHGC